MSWSESAQTEIAANGIERAIKARTPNRASIFAEIGVNMKMHTDIKI
jgi:hypothetical protein